MGRWSFLGFRPRAVLRWSAASTDPYALSPRMSRYRIAPLEGLPPFAGGAVGTFGYDLARAVEPSIGAANPDEVGVPELAVMVTDVLLAFDHLRHEVTVLANVLAEGDVESAYGEAATAIAEVRERLRGRSHPARAGGARAAELPAQPGAGRLRARSSERRSTSAPATSTRWCRASVGARPVRSRRSPSTAACAPSTPARTCTSSTSRTSRSPAPRPSRS